jgi:hypothetical protein
VAIVVVRGTEPEGAQLSRDEVLRIATQAFREHGLALSDYTDPEVLYQVAGPQRTWGVYLERRGAAPGNQFGVEIDDQTSEVKFRYGA